MSRKGFCRNPKDILPKEISVWILRGRFLVEMFCSGKQEKEIHSQKSIQQCAANGEGQKGICHFFLFRSTFEMKKKKNILSPNLETVLVTFFAYPLLPPHFRGRVTPAELTNQIFGSFAAKISTARIWP